MDLGSVERLLAAMDFIGISSYAEQLPVSKACKSRSLCHQQHQNQHTRPLHAKLAALLAKRLSVL